MRLGPHIIHHRGLVLAGGVAKSASGLGGRAVLIGSLSSPPPPTVCNHLCLPTVKGWATKKGVRRQEMDRAGREPPVA